jgi:hypothetical protein
MAVAGSICKRTLSNVAAGITEEVRWTSNQICQMPCSGCMLRKLPPRNWAEVCVTMAVFSTSLYPEIRKCELVLCRRGIRESFQINLPCIGRSLVGCEMIGSISRCKEVAVHWRRACGKISHIRQQRKETVLVH